MVLDCLVPFLCGTTSVVKGLLAHSRNPSHCCRTWILQRPSFGGAANPAVARRRFGWGGTAARAFLAAASLCAPRNATASSFAPVRLGPPPPNLSRHKV